MVLRSSETLYDGTDCSVVYFKVVSGVVVIGAVVPFVVVVVVRRVDSAIVVGIGLRRVVIVVVISGLEVLLGWGVVGRAVDVCSCVLVRGCVLISSLVELSAAVALTNSSDGTSEGSVLTVTKSASVVKAIVVESSVVATGLVVVGRTGFSGGGFDGSGDVSATSGGGFCVVDSSVISTHEIEVTVSVTVDQSIIDEVEGGWPVASTCVGVVVCWPLASASSTTTQVCSVGTDCGIAIVVSRSLTIHV